MNNNLKTLICDIFYSPICNYLITKVGGGVALWTDLHTRSQKKKLLSNARKEFQKGSSLGDFNDYKKALYKHWVSYSEYAHQYEFYKKSEEERDEYVSRLRMGYFYWRYVPGTQKQVFRNKTRFLKTFASYIHRKWLYAPKATFEDFEQMISNYDCIIKPCGGKLGRGVTKVYKDGDHTDDRKIYDSCRKNKMLVEQCIESCDELSAFHPQSLNTIRVVTIGNKEKSEVLGSFLRVGVGDSVVDNAHAGGIFAQINIKEGVIESDGIDVNGNCFKRHPDSGVGFIGFHVPQWETIVETCCEAAKLIGNPIIGWDVAVNNQGEVEFVEGNYGPDFDVMQSPLKIGVKKRVFTLIKEYCGIEMK